LFTPTCPHGNEQFHHEEHEDHEEKNVDGFRLPVSGFSNR
jgi:hypothetical protein